MGPEQVLSNSLNWPPCSEPAELWVSLWVFQPADCGIRLQPHQKEKVRCRARGFPFAFEFGRYDSPIEPELNRHADDVVRNRSPRCGSSRLTPRSRNSHRAGPTDTPDFSPAHLSCGRPTWCPVTVPLAGTARRLERTPLAKGSNVGRRSAKACHETSGVGQVEWRVPLAQ